jgi:hypothetical protein
MTEAEIQAKYGPEFRRCLESLDVQGMKKLWKHVAPHLADENDSHVLYSMHLARTEMKSLPLRAKLYSQRWLNERGLGSGMPNDNRGH